MATPTFILPSAPTYTEGFVNGLNVYPNPTNFVANQVPFTRATTATRTNAAGLIELTPYNQVSWSEMFTDSYWAKIQCTITANTTTAPNGTLTADTFTGDGTNDLHYIRANQPINIGTSYTWSVYAKKNTNDFIQVFYGLGFTTQDFANFDLNNGVVGTIGTTATATITNVGNGWYRCSVTATATSSATNFTISYGLITSATSPRGQVNSLSTSVFIWGAQLVEGISALPYQLTETRLNRPRVDFSLGGCPNLLLEPQRTNLFAFSEQFDNASWNKGFSSITSNSTISPSGVQNADTFLADGTNAPHNVAQSISVISGTTYSFSVYAKKNTNNFLQLTPLSTVFGVNVWANFDLNNGVVGSVGSSATASIQSVGNGWYRCSITGAALSTSSVFIALIIVSSASSLRAESNTLSTSVFLWGAQFELGAYPTSYVPTTAATVTRNSDTFTLSNVFTNNLISSAGGTWFVDLRDNQVLIRDTFAALSLFQTSAVTNSFVFFNHSSGAGGRIQISKFISGTATTLYTTTSNTSKIAIKWNGTTADIFENGVKVVSATAFTTTNMDSLTTNSGLRATINSMALWNTPLTDDELEVITGEGFDTYALMASNYNYILQ
jgi:hypothetical protein